MDKKTCKHRNRPVRKYQYTEGNDTCVGFSELKDNCWNFSVISDTPGKGALYNEFCAGVVLGRMQGEEMLKASRNNTWKNTYLCDPKKTFVKTLPPSEETLAKAEDCLRTNLQCTATWIGNNRTNKFGEALRRLAMRMLGIYCGATEARNGIPDADNIGLEELEKHLNDGLGYGDADLSLLDVYFINAQMDLFDAVSSSLEATYGLYKPDHCSAFLKRTKDGDIVWTHNSWCGFLSQSHTVTFAIGNGSGGMDFITQNSYCPGQVGSNMDFGFNGHGICFNETTHRYSYNPLKYKEQHLWLCWRAAAAEMFATSIDEFYEYLSLDNSGTYLNGYMLADARKKETALIEMSYKRFVMFKYDKEKKATFKDSTEVFDMNLDYDSHLITPDYILGVNYPVSKKVAYDLSSTDNRPMRRVQFFDRIGGVNDVETAKELITYIAEDEPLSVYGRWDLGIGTTEYPKTIPDGAVDAKAFSCDKVCQLLDSLKFQPNEQSTKTSFWMLYGVPFFKGKPFVWSESQWKEYKEDPEKDFVPDELSGAWNETKIFMD